jgi:hypothetical protein
MFFTKFMLDPFARPFSKVSSEVWPVAGLISKNAWTVPVSVVVALDDASPNGTTGATVTAI